MGRITIGSGEPADVVQVDTSPEVQKEQLTVYEPVEVIKEVIVEKIVYVDKPIIQEKIIEVVREVPVTREVPVEVIKEVVVNKEVPVEVIKVQTSYVDRIVRKTEYQTPAWAYLVMFGEAVVLFCVLMNLK